MINSYSSIYNLGHAAIADLLKFPVIVEEKVDGSQLSFRLTEDGELEMRSKGAMLNLCAPEGMFKRAVDSITERKGLLVPGWTYRGEYLNSPHHNALTYSRVPRGNVILFDVDQGGQSYVEPIVKSGIAAGIDLECVPVLYEGLVSDAAQFRALLETDSVLGGQKIEGVVIKPADYKAFGRDKKVLMGKFVSEAFREVQGRTWDEEHKPKGPQDILQILRSEYASPARWQKALIHLREAGQIQDDPRDIGLLMKEVPMDIEMECSEELREKLIKWAWPQLRRMVTHGLPEWYKEQLLKKQFEK